MDRTIPSTTLALLAEELGRTRAAVDGLGRLVSELVRAHPPAERSRLLTEAQAIDALDQHLHALAAFVGDLAAGRTPAAAAAAIPLAEVAARLSGLAPAPRADPRSDGGHMEMFD